MPKITAHTGLAAIAAVLAMGAAVTAFGVSSPSRDADGPRFQVVVDELVVPSMPANSMTTMRRALRVASGDTLTSLLSSIGASDAEFLEFVSTDKAASRLRKLAVGSVIHAVVDNLGRVHELRYSLGLDEDSYETGAADRVVVRRTIEGLSATVEAVELVRTTRIQSARIENSLYAATKRAGIPDKVASQVADVIGGDVNFERDIRKGDELRVVYETLLEPDSLDGEVPGRVLAVEMINRGRSYTALWLEDESGAGMYYDFSGRSAQKTFLRYPIEYARISSKFTGSRMHPLHGKIKAHKGVDLAARHGTKIRASGDGKIQFIGNQRGYGRTVVIKHSDRYSTLYAHMRGYRRNLRWGQTVKKGDVIGYVGSSGWATGPHLHYEFRVNGRQQDPLTVDFPEEKPLGSEMRDRHASMVRELRAQFTQLDPVMVAANFE